MWIGPPARVADEPAASAADAAATRRMSPPAAVIVVVRSLITTSWTGLTGSTPPGPAGAPQRGSREQRIVPFRRRYETHVTDRCPPGLCVRPDQGPSGNP